MPDDASIDTKSLRRRLNQRLYLRPVDLARAAGLGVTQIRTYERLGFLPPAERGSNGYRRYSEAHVEALRVARILITGYGWQHALDVMRAVHAGDRPTVYVLVNARHAALDHQHTRIKAALDTIDTILQTPPEPTTARITPPMRISEAARTVGVRPSAVRFWEQQNLLHPTREPTTAYRRYTPTDLARLNIVALLRDVGYQFDAIREVLDELSSGRPDHVRQALENRLQTLHQTTTHCMKATAALHTYLHPPDPPTTTATEEPAAVIADQ